MLFLNSSFKIYNPNELKIYPLIIKEIKLINQNLPYFLSIL